MKIEKGVSLKELTTFKIGGPARYFCRVTSVKDIGEAVQFAVDKGLPLFVLGGGSNVLMSDEGFSGLVAKMDILGVSFESKGKYVVEVTVGAGESWDELVCLTVAKNLSGLENLSGIPGTVGAAPVQNIGAYGAELADALSFVEVFDVKSGKVKILKNKDCRFGYRDSVFKSPRGKNFIITRVGLVLRKSGKVNIAYKDLVKYFAGWKEKPTVASVREAVLAIRSKKFPDLSKYGTAGSFFKNPIIARKDFEKLRWRFPDLPNFPAGRGKVKISLGWILEHVCRLKGARAGSVGTFPNQALVVVNYGGAKASEVEQFAAGLAAAVFEKTGLTPEWEVQKVM